MPSRCESLRPLAGQLQENGFQRRPLSADLLRPQTMRGQQLQHLLLEPFPRTLDADAISDHFRVRDGGQAADVPQGHLVSHPETQVDRCIQASDQGRDGIHGNENEFGSWTAQPTAVLIRGNYWLMGRMVKWFQSILFARRAHHSCLANAGPDDESCPRGPSRM